MRKFIITGIAVAMLAVPAAASADVTNNETTRDAQGYCIANHLHNGWSEDNPFNGDFNGIGHLRSQQSGKAISGSAGNRAPAEHCITPQGTWGPISNNAQ
jgi:hypothetical protein